MARHDKRFRPHLFRLEDRNPCSDTLGAILANLGIASLFDSEPADSSTFAPPSLLSAVDYSYLSRSTNDHWNIATTLTPATDPTVTALFPSLRPSSSTPDDASNDSVPLPTPFANDDSLLFAGAFAGGL